LPVLPTDSHEVQVTASLVTGWVHIVQAVPTVFDNCLGLDGFAWAFRGELIERADDRHSSNHNTNVRCGFQRDDHAMVCYHWGRHQSPVKWGGDAYVCVCVCVCV
jgi:hypothetical protein